MKVKLLSAIIAATFLAGCSSSGSDSPNEPAGVASVQTFDGEHFDGMAIQGDNGEVTTVAIRGEEGNTVFNVGGELYYTDGEVVKDSSGEVVGHIEVRNNELIFVNDDGFVHLSVEDGRLVVEEAKLNPVHPIEPTPEHPIAGSPSNPVEPIPEHPIADGPVNPIEITPENPIEATPEPAMEASAKSLTPEQRTELKQKVQSLSQEQRQEIKRAIRDRIERS
ncbi:RAD23 family protein [Vibrio sp. VNB-15]